MAQLTAPLQVIPVNTDHRSTTPVLNPGVRAVDNEGKEYTYVLAGADIDAMEAVVQGSAAHAVVPSSAAQQGVIGVATADFASGEYGFIQTRGYVQALVVDATAAGSLLATGTNAGTLELAEATDLTARPAVVVVPHANSDTVGALINLL